jgi:hypothetical protein
MLEYDPLIPQNSHFGMKITFLNWYETSIIQSLLVLWTLLSARCIIAGNIVARVLIRHKLEAREEIEISLNFILLGSRLGDGLYLV